MAVNRETARLSKILVETDGIDFGTAEARLLAMSVDIVVGPDAATTAAGQAAVLTAVSVGRRSFIGGVRVGGSLDAAVVLPPPFGPGTLVSAAVALGATTGTGEASQTIVIGEPRRPVGGRAVAARFEGWRAGYGKPRGIATTSRETDNPLAGIAAGALAVGSAFDAARGREAEPEAMISLWDPLSTGIPAPGFHEVFLPDAIWLMGLGNLGQAYLRALASLPYQDPGRVELVLQDDDRVSAENWGTSVLVRADAYGSLKTRIGEDWALARGFRVRRVDRRLNATERLLAADPRVALSGFDSIASRRDIGSLGFEAVVDAGLGRTSTDYDRYRVNVFDRHRPIERHFEDRPDPAPDDDFDAVEGYRRLEAAAGRCGMVEIAGASAAVPHVSAFAATVAITRLIQIASGCACAASEVGWLRDPEARRAAGISTPSERGIGHAGRARPHPPQRRSA